MEWRQKAEMDRAAKAVTSLLAAIILLTGCTRPGDVDTDIPYVDTNPPGIIPGVDGWRPPQIGSDAWG